MPIFTSTRSEATAALSQHGRAVTALRPTTDAFTRLAICTIAGNITYVACQFGMTVALAKLGTPELLGQFALALALTTPIMLFTQLNLRAVQVSDAKESHSASDYVSARLATTSVALSVICVGALATGADAGVTVAIVLIALAKSLDGITDVVFGLWQQRDRLDAASAVYAGNGLLSLAGLTVGIALGGSLTWGCAAMLLGPITALCVAVRATRTVVPGESLRPRWDPPRTLSLLRLAFPLGPVMLLIALNSNAPRYFVALYLGHGDLGIFAAVSALAIAGSTLVAAVGQTLSPGLARHHSAGNLRALRSTLRKFAAAALALGAIGVAIAYLAGRFLLSILYSPQYADAHGLLVGVMAAAAIAYAASSLGYGITAARRFAVQAPLFALVTVATAAAAALLVPTLGLPGAVWAMAIGSLVQAAGAAILVLGGPTASTR